MKNKIIKILIVILILAIIILGALYIIDHIRMNDNKPVLFSTWGKKYSAPLEKKSEKIVSMYKTIIDRLMENNSALYSTDKYISLDVESLKAPETGGQEEYLPLTEEEQNELLDYCKKYHGEVKSLSIEELKAHGYNKGDDNFISLEGVLWRVIEIEKLTENRAVISFQAFHSGLGAIMPKYELKYKNGEWEITNKEMAIS